MTAPAVDEFDPRRARGATGLLATFNSAGVLLAADVHVAARLGRLGGETDETVLLALALAVRGVRLGSVCVELAQLHGTVVGEAEDPGQVSALPWPEPGAWRAACAASPLVADGPQVAGAAVGDGGRADRALAADGPQAIGAAVGNGARADRALAADGPQATGAAVGNGARADRALTDGPQAAGRAARLVDGLLYLERYWQLEEQVRAELERRAGILGEVDTARLRAALDRLFPPPEPEPGDCADPGPDRQRLAAAIGAVRGLTVLAGGPGTGKTTTVARLLAVAAAGAPPGRAPRVALAAPTGKAAARLEEAVRAQVGGLDAEDRERLGELRASTLHRLLGAHPGTGRFRYDRTNRLPFELVVVDETSMVSLTLMARLLEALRPQARLILVGDPDQLASVEAGAVLGDLTRATAGRPDTRATAGRPDTALAATLADLGVDGGPDAAAGVVTLVRTYRFGGAIAELAAAIQAGDAETTMRVLRAGHDDVRFVERDAPTSGATASSASASPPADVARDVHAAARRLAEAALTGDAHLALAALDAHRVLCGHRRGPFGASWWDPEVERRLGIPPGRPWYPGRPVLVTANDPETGLFNGDVGVVVLTGEGPRVAFARGGEPMLVAPARLGPVQTVHAMTVHRAQGSQFAEVTVVVPAPESPLLTRELLYTAVTRARAGVRVVGSEAAIRTAVARPVSRASGLRHRLGAPHAPGPPRPDGQAGPDIST